MEKIKRLFVLEGNPILSFLIWQVILRFEFFDNLETLKAGDYVRYNWMARVCFPKLAINHIEKNKGKNEFLVRGVYRMRPSSYHMHVDFERPMGAGADTFWVTKIKKKNLYESGGNSSGASSHLQPV